MGAQYLSEVLIRAKPLFLIMHPHGIVHQSEDVAGISLSTLGARSTLQIANDFDGITATFLMLRMRYLLQIEGLTADEGPIGVIINHGDAVAGEVQNAINHQNTAGPDDVTQTVAQADALVAIHSSLRMFKLYDGGTRGQLHTSWFKIGKKGIPFPEGKGWSAHIWNADSVALTAGGLVKGVIQYQGVWLRD